LLSADLQPQVELSEDGEVKAGAYGDDLGFDSWQQQLNDAICVSFAGKAAQQVSGV
jgi:hypothetical protein